jgi:KUP system potassium uptake protein
MEHAAISGPLTTLPKKRISASLTLAALGVVFGDLGTSPLYALQEAFHGANGVPTTPDNVVGVVSLFLWALFLIVSLKYVTVLMRADNHGEGGLLALLSLLIGDRNNQPAGRRARRWIVLAINYPGHFSTQRD